MSKGKGKRVNADEAEEAQPQRQKISFKELTQHGDSAIVIPNATIFAGKGPYGNFFGIGNDSVVLFVNERTVAYDDLEELYQRLADKVFNMKFEAVETGTGRIAWRLARVEILRTRDTTVKRGPEVVDHTANATLDADSA